MKIKVSSSWPWGLLLLIALALVCGLAWASETQSGSGSKESGKKMQAAKDSKNLARLTQRPAAPSGDDYVIGPQDVLTINVWREAEISRDVPVRPDGKISLPLLGDVVASGLSPNKLQAKLTERLKAYLSNPEVTVIVREVNSQKFNIVGEVTRPGSYPLFGPMTVLDAVAVAGGFLEFAKTKKIYVLRRLEDGSRIRIPFNYQEVIRGKKASLNVELQSGDTIVVP